MSDDQSSQARESAAVAAPVEIVPDAAARPGASAPDDDERERSAISEPGKLLRIALMLRELQAEVRDAPTDEAGRALLKQVHAQALDQMCSVLSEDLRDELSSLTIRLSEGTPSESELRLAQAQLIGWLEGLFQGIQAAIASQQMMARHQLEQMRPRGLPPGGGRPGAPPGEESRRSTGQYL